MKKKTAVIFDLDGTLLDTLDDITESLNHVMVKYRFPVGNRDRVRSFVGNGAKKLVERMMYSKSGELDVEVADPVLAEACYKEFRAHYAENLNVKTAPYDGIITLLDTLSKRNVPMAVVSNKPDDAVKELCSSHFAKYINIAIGDKEGRKRKPDPTVLLDVVNDGVRVVISSSLVVIIRLLARKYKWNLPKA